MSARTTLSNGLGWGLALLLAAYGGSMSSGRGLPSTVARARRATQTQPEPGPNGALGLRDAGGRWVELRHYARIASATLVADQALLELCDPSRIVAFSAPSQEFAPDPWRYRAKAALDARASVEAILDLAPDLLLVSNLVDPGHVARLREHGITVFDFGPMRGLETLLPNLLALGHLVGAPQEAARYAEKLAGRLGRVARTDREQAAPRALYLSPYADHLYGGANHTSYHDLLIYAGLRDVAAEAGFSGWPELNAEQVLSMDPELVVTKQGMGHLLCRHPGLAQLAPCRGEGRVIEIPKHLVDHPGPVLLDATEALHNAVWGTEPPRP